MNQGVDPDWLLDLDLLSFNAFADSALRIEMNRELENAWLTALAFNDTKSLMKQLKESRQATGQPHLDGDDFARQVGSGM